MQAAGADGLQSDRYPGATEGVEIRRRAAIGYTADGVSDRGGTSNRQCTASLWENREQRKPEARDEVDSRRPGETPIQPASSKKIFERGASGTRGELTGVMK